MALKSEQLVNDSEAARSRPIELITENGFSIVRACDLRACDLDGGSTPEVGSYGFVVCDPHGYELDISVEIDPSTVLEVVKRSAGRISGDSSYWGLLRRTTFGGIPWEYDDYPPAAMLKVDQLSPDDIDLARRWES